MADLTDLCRRFGLRKLEIQDCRLSYPGNEPREADFFKARCFGQCAGGDFNQVEELERELGDMYRERRAKGSVSIKCPRLKDTRRLSTRNQPVKRARPSPNAQSCLGNLSARIVVEFEE
jgi:hypothetical protein